MSERVTMPALGESVTEGTVTRWLKEVGDEVAVDEPLLEVSTDKVDTEIPSPVGGVLQEVLVEVDETVPVGADLAVVGDGAPSSSSDSGSDPKEDTQEEAAAPEPQQDASRESDDAKTDGSDSSGAESESSSSSAQSSGGEVADGEKITMPALGESVTEGTITRWLKAEGDEVAVDEPLLEVSTDKVDTEVPSPAAGVLTKILVQEDETVEVGADLAIVGGEASGSSEPDRKPEPEAEKKPEPEPEPEKKPEPEKPEPEPQVEKEPEPQTPEPAQKPAPQPSESTGGDERDAAAYVTPLVRKLAQEKGVDLASITGTGVGGRIRKQDVLAAAEEAAKPEESAPAAPAASSAASGSAASVPEVSAKRGTTEPLSRTRKVIAQRMTESLHTAAQLTTVIEVDVTKVARLRAKHKDAFHEREGVKLSFMPFFALAACEALKSFPVLNASIEDDNVVYHGQENLGIAVDTERGLMVPVIHDAGDLNIAGLARKIADLAERTRGNKIKPDELGGATFSLTNTGSRGALFDTPIFAQPQVGILGTGSVVKRPVVVTDADGGETIAIRSMVYLALSYDHRLVDGADAARFLADVKERLEEGAFEL